MEDVSTTTFSPTQGTTTATQKQRERETEKTARDRAPTEERVVVVVEERERSKREKTKRNRESERPKSDDVNDDVNDDERYPTSRVFLKDAFNIVSAINIYPYPIASKSFATTTTRKPHSNAQKKGIIMPASRSASSSLLLDRVSTTTTTFRRRRRSVFRRASRVVVSPKAETTTEEKETSSSSSLEERVATVPYFNDARAKRVLVGKAGSELLERRNCRDFIALPNEENSSALVKLRETIDEGWQRHELQGYGHASQWPEIFERAECLIREQFPQFGEECEILAGTGWLEDESEAIDWVIRRPEKHVIASKIPFAKRMHRDPDSWTNPSTSQRPREGWTKLSMQDIERYQYRFINVHLITSALDPTYNAWQSPLVVMLPRESGKREWPFEKQTLTMTEEGAKDESKLEGKNGINPFSWIKGGNRLTRFAHKKEDKPPQSDVIVEETDISDFEFPELTHSDEQEFVTNGALLFDSFDCWHGAAAWCEDKSFKKKLTDIDPKGRQPFHSARCSIEMRFRVRIDQQSKQGKASPSVPWGPFSSAVRSGKFVDARALRDSEARYDLNKGRQI